MHNQVKQLIGLRHKPITLQDALPRSDSQPRFSAKAGPVVSIRDIPFVILANPRGPRYDLDPEIERTQKQLKRRIRDLMERNNNNGQPPADGQ
ncbi:hypothetical protein V6N11_002223 [Hibiscus sabdariffa]|uniref:Uncharacterized protein n=1 Tax=Hibiscus sabdariffa TaxID=183260 RepID=A0ABR2QUT6_9ROSI